MHVVHPRKKRDMRIQFTVGPARSKVVALLHLHSGTGPHRDKRRSAKVNERATWKKENA
jgi:hypothetical protein